MKKSILALTAVLTVGSAFAATTSTSTTSTTSLAKKTLDKILENTTASYYGAYYKDNQGIASERTSFYHEITGTYNYGSGSVYIRPRFSSVDGDDQAAHWRNPRMGVRPWSWSSGKLSSSNEIRLEVAMDDTGADTTDTDQYYGIIRYAQSLNYTPVDGLTLTAWAGLYENIVKDNDLVSESTKNRNLLLMDPTISYAFNDQHSVSVDYQMASYLEEGALRGADIDFYSNLDADNTLYMRYINSQIKNVSIIPGLYLQGNEFENFGNDGKYDGLGLQLEITARL